MEKNLQSLFNYCSGLDNDAYVEVVIRHAIGPKKRAVPIFRSLPQLTGIFVGNNQQGDGAVIRVCVGDIRAMSRAIAAGLVEVVELV
jgi:hypothetical protein